MTTKSISLAKILLNEINYRKNKIRYVVEQINNKIEKDN